MSIEEFFKKICIDYEKLENKKFAKIIYRTAMKDWTVKEDILDVPQSIPYEERKEIHLRNSFIKELFAHYDFVKVIDSCQFGIGKYGHKMYRFVIPGDDFGSKWARKKKTYRYVCKCDYCNNFAVMSRPLPEVVCDSCRENDAMEKVPVFVVKEEIN